MMEILERGYAKINLHLDVTGRLEGGYHRVETVMQTVTLFDEVTLRRKEEGDSSVTLSCNVKGVPTDEKNLAYRALMLFFEKTGRSVGVHIHIEKSIPMAAGMAGGSADAAAVFRGINRLVGEPLSTGELCALGASLGADVPFCIAEGCAFADGRGDNLHPFPPMPDCTLTVACEGEGVSTPWAYGLLDELFGGFYEGSTYRKRSTEPLREAMESGEPERVSTAMYNIFEEPVLSRRPAAARLKAMMLENGAMGAMMSGSGPSVFGVFATEEGARCAKERMEREGIRVYLCKPYCPTKIG